MPSSRIDRCRCPLAGGLVVDDSVGGFFIIFEHGVTRRWDPCGRGLGTGVGSNAPADRSWPKCAKAPCQICGGKIEKWRQNMLENGLDFGYKLSGKWVRRGSCECLPRKCPGFCLGNGFNLGGESGHSGHPNRVPKVAGVAGPICSAPGKKALRLGSGLVFFRRPECYSAAAEYSFWNGPSIYEHHFVGHPLLTPGRPWN